MKQLFYYFNWNPERYDNSGISINTIENFFHSSENLSEKAEFLKKAVYTALWTDGIEFDEDIDIIKRLPDGYSKSFEECGFDHSMLSKAKLDEIDKKSYSPEEFTKLDGFDSFNDVCDQPNFEALIKLAAELYQSNTPEILLFRSRNNSGNWFEFVVNPFGALPDVLYFGIEDSDFEIGDYFQNTP